MTVTAVMIINQAGVDTLSGWYNIWANVYASDGTTDGGVSAFIRLPLNDALAHRRANRLLREDAAARLLSNYGWVIDPEDIYCPLS